MDEESTENMVTGQGDEVAAGAGNDANLEDLLKEFSVTKKKKKKKPIKIDDEDGEDDDKVIEAEPLLEATGQVVGKVVEAKEKDADKENELEGPEPVAILEGEKYAPSWVDSDRDYEYKELLQRVFAIIKEKNPDIISGEKKRLVMRPPQVLRVGTKKTSFANFLDICKSYVNLFDRFICIISLRYYFFQIAS